MERRWAEVEERRKTRWGGRRGRERARGCDLAIIPIRMMQPNGPGVRLGVRVYKVESSSWGLTNDMTSCCVCASLYLCVSCIQNRIVAIS